MKKNKNNILFIGDTQFPFEHEDYLDFCTAVEEKHNCGRIIHVGDVADLYAFSRYEKSPDAISTNEEIIKLQNSMEEWATCFPKVEVVLGNHDKRIINKLRGSGIPSTIISDSELLHRTLNCPTSWTLHDRLVVSHRYGKTLVIHGDEKGATIRAGGNISKTGMSVVQGHHHSSAFILFRSTPDELKYDMIVGCGIDDSKIPFDYNKKDLNRPILSCAVLVDGYPYIEVMRLDNNGRWIGEV